MDDQSKNKGAAPGKQSRWTRLVKRATKLYEYCAKDVWEDTTNTLGVNVIKTLNITIKSFMSTDVQTQACAMTYRTLLAMVPALALIFAIGRGFGLSGYIYRELYSIFPSQRLALEHALKFVDSYLSQASEGIFVGVGIVFLLYTVINLINCTENAFNIIWNVRTSRSIWRQITDYTAMMLILPLLMICGGGLSIFLSTSIQKFFHFDFISPLISVFFEIGSFLFICLFFTGVFMMIPNTKVKLKFALISGLLTGIGFQVLQWVFVSGQLYVAKYNAIYGSFSFLPLLLIWMQLVWVIILCGALICYASQNIMQYSYSDQISDIARDYYEKITVAICTVVVQNFANSQPPIAEYEIVKAYSLPSRLVSDIIDRLCKAGILARVITNPKHMSYGFQPAVPTNMITINYLRSRLNQMGNSNFIPSFDHNFGEVAQLIDSINAKLAKETSDILLQDIRISST